MQILLRIYVFSVNNPNFGEKSKFWPKSQKLHGNIRKNKWKFYLLEKCSVEYYNVLPIWVGRFCKSLISGLLWFSVYFGQNRKLNKTNFLYDIIAHTNPFGVFYRLDKCFCRSFFIHRTLHPGKIYDVKNN